jgi:uncharacterized membrane protein
LTYLLSLKIRKTIKLCDKGLQKQQIEGKSLNDASKSSEVKKAVILLSLAGVLQFFLGYQSYQFSIMLPLPVLAIMGTIMLVFGILSFCASLAIWMQKSWATTIITGIGIMSCGTLVMFGYYLVGFFFALVFYAAICYIKSSRVTQSSDWDDI